MSGPKVSRALGARFEAIRRAEIERLSRKKLRGMSDAEREVVDAVTEDIIRAIARIPERVLFSERLATPAGERPADIAALVQLFNL
jgi:hypothetical protein